MSIQRVGKDDVEVFTLRTNPHRTFSSSSAGVTGSVQLFARSSPVEKDAIPMISSLTGSFNEHALTKTFVPDFFIGHDVTDLSSIVSTYMSNVNAQSRSQSKLLTIPIRRIVPPIEFNSDTCKKNTIRNVLYPHYRNIAPGAHWAYTNYNTLNFFSASNVPASSVLLYASSASATNSDRVSGSYVVTGAFTFEFYINPRYTSDDPGHPFRAGTILHLSSTYAVSLVSGSSKGSDGRPNAFRLLLQVSGGADTAPSRVTTGSGAETAAERTAANMIFLSADNSLLLNHWHHVAIRWSAMMNDHTGSFLVDGEPKGQFVVPYVTIAPKPWTSRENPDVLCVGNYFEGTNATTNKLSMFFSSYTNTREGLDALIGGSSLTPDTFTFNHPLNAELHEIKIHDSYVPIDVLSASMFEGSLETGSMLFYVPPFFTKRAPFREKKSTDGNGVVQGGVPITPVETISGTTVDPFNVAYSFGLGGRLINLENFTRDFITGKYPRLLHLTTSNVASLSDDTIGANALLYDETTNFYTGSIRKRNATILPCDNGKFKPNFALLTTGAFDPRPSSGSELDKYKNDVGNLDLSIVSLANMVSTGSQFRALAGLKTGSIFSELAGPSPEHIGLAKKHVLTVFQRTLDPSSNEIVMFDISNMFYGDRIMPGTFSLVDHAVTGTKGRLSITLRDNGVGGLYRADSATPHAKWSNVGDVLYDEGLAIVKAPTLPFFGKDGFTTTMQGERNVHILRINAIARAGEINSSSNPTFDETISASVLSHDAGEGFVYITGINFHDDNLNVIMKAKLAQPILKRDRDRYLFKISHDF